MIFTKSTISVALSLLSLTTALPASQSFTLTTRDDTQCKAGKTFYVCQLNGFRGCCTIDPCGSVAGCPDDTADPIPKPPVCEKGNATVYQPKMQTLQGGAEPISTPNIDLYKSATEERYQTMTFTVPANAKSCGLGWGVPAERNFTAGNNARVQVWEGTDTTHSIGSADFTNWPGVDGPHPHTVGPVDCKEKMEFTTKLAVTSEQLGQETDDNDKETHVSLVQNEETGWFIEYDCKV